MCSQASDKQFSKLMKLSSEGIEEHYFVVLGMTAVIYLEQIRF